MDQDANAWKTLFKRANQLLRATTHPAVVQLPVEGSLPSLAGATQWLNSPPLTTAGLRGHVVLIDFWTYTCINWLRTLPYLHTRAGSRSVISCRSQPLPSGSLNEAYEA